MISSWSELFSDDELRVLAMRKFDVDIPLGATNIKLGEGRNYREVGRVTKMIPDERYSRGLFVHRNPTYTQVEESIIETEAILMWMFNGERYYAKVVLV